MSESEPRFATAMDVVRAAASGQISRHELVRILRSWNYEPEYRTGGITDDWESRSNSFEAVVHAFIVDLIDEGDYRHIVQGLDDADVNEDDAAGPGPASA